MRVKIFAFFDWELLILDHLIGSANRGGGRTSTVEDLFEEGYGAICGSGGDGSEVLSAGKLYG